MVSSVRLVSPWCRVASLLLTVMLVTLCTTWPCLSGPVTPSVFRFLSSAGAAIVLQRCTVAVRGGWLRCALVKCYLGTLVVMCGCWTELDSRKLFCFGGAPGEQ